MHVNPNAFECDLGDAVVVFETDGAEYFRLHGVARSIWLALRRTTKVDSVVESLMAEYDIEEHQCRASVARFVSELTSCHLLIE